MLKWLKHHFRSTRANCLHWHTWTRSRFASLERRDLLLKTNSLEIEASLPSLTQLVVRSAPLLHQQPPASLCWCSSIFHYLFRTLMMLSPFNLNIQILFDFVWLLQWPCCISVDGDIDPYFPSQDVAVVFCVKTTLSDLELIYYLSKMQRYYENLLPLTWCQIKNGKHSSYHHF